MSTSRVGNSDRITAEVSALTTLICKFKIYWGLPSPQQLRIKGRWANSWFLSINKRLLTGPQLTTNTSTRSIIWRLKSFFFSAETSPRPY